MQVTGLGWGAGRYPFQLVVERVRALQKLPLLFLVSLLYLEELGLQLPL